jgi:hypothetical protein
MIVVNAAAGILVLAAKTFFEFVGRRLGRSQRDLERAALAAARAVDARGEVHLGKRQAPGVAHQLRELHRLHVVERDPLEVDDPVGRDRDFASLVSVT